jgi:hypothetical protein
VGEVVGRGVAAERKEIETALADALSQ